MQGRTNPAFFSASCHAPQSARTALPSPARTAVQKKRTCVRFSVPADARQALTRQPVPQECFAPLSLYTRLCAGRSSAYRSSVCRPSAAGHGHPAECRRPRWQAL